MKDKIKKLILNAITEFAPAFLKPENADAFQYLEEMIRVSLVKNPKNGDYSTNIALLLTDILNNK
jgi:hypothetical protein